MVLHGSSKILLGEKHHLTNNVSAQRNSPAFDPGRCMRHHENPLQLLRLKTPKKDSWNKKTFSHGTLCPLLIKLCSSPIRSAVFIFISHVEPKDAEVPSLYFRLLAKIPCSQYLHIILQPTMVPLVHWRQLNNRIFWSKYKETRESLKAARITATICSFGTCIF